MSDRFFFGCGLAERAHPKHLSGHIDVPHLRLAVRSSRLALFSSVGILLGVAAAVAEESAAKAVQVVAPPSGGSSSSAAEIKTTDRIARATITLRNPGGAPVSVKTDKEFRNLVDASTEPARWRLLQTGVGPDDNGLLSLGAASEASFEVVGTFERAASYLTGLTVADNGTERRFTVQITRVMAAVPADLIQATQPAQLDVPFYGLETPRSSTTVVPVRNTSTAAVAFDRTSIIRFGRLDGEAESAVAGGTGPTIRMDDCPRELLAKQDCALNVELPSGLQPGRYAVGIALSGPGGGQSTGTIRINVRLSAVWAALAVAIGAIAGFLVSTWREKGRTILQARIVLSKMRSHVLRLAEEARDPDVGGEAKRLRGKLDMLQELIVQGGDATAGLNDLGDRYEALALSERTLRSFDDSRNLDLLRCYADRLKASLKCDGWMTADVRTRAHRLQTGIAAIPGLETALEALPDIENEEQASAAWTRSMRTADAAQQARNVFDRATQAALAPLDDPDDDPDRVIRARIAELRTARQGLLALRDPIRRAALTAISTVIEAALNARPDPGPARKSALVALKDDLANALNTETIDADTLTAILAKAAKLDLSPPPSTVPESLAPGVLEIPSVVSKDSGLTIDLNLFRLWRGASAEALGMAFYGWELLTNILVLVGISLAGISVLWTGNPAWGSTTDFVVALLAGAGSRLAIGPIGRTTASS